MFPWRFTIHTPLPKETVLQRLSDATDPAVGLAFGTNLPGPNEPKSKQFAGRVDSRRMTLKLLMDPYDLFRFNPAIAVKTFLHGRIFGTDCETKIVVWMRPDFYQMSVVSIALFASFMVARSGEMRWSYAVLMIVFITVLAIWTQYQLRKAKYVLTNVIEGRAQE